MIRFILLGGPLYIICRCLLWIKCHSLPCSFMLSAPSVLRMSGRVLPVGHFLHLPATMLLCFSPVRGTLLLVPGALILTRFLHYKHGPCCIVRFPARPSPPPHLMPGTQGTLRLCGRLRGSACSHSALVMLGDLWEGGGGFLGRLVFRDRRHGKW